MDDLRRIAEALRGGRKWLVVGHFQPDADSYGACGAAAAALRKLGLEAACLNENGAVDFYRFIPGVAGTLSEFPPGEWDGALVCDCADPDRIGGRLKAPVLALPRVINIDHHFSNTMFGAMNFVRSEASSTSELIFDLICELGAALDAAIAESLLAGVMADTGMFRYSSVSARTFEVAAALTRAGARPHEIARRLYGDRRLSAVLLQAEALRGMQLSSAGALAMVVVAPEMMERFGASGEDCENLVEAARDVAGVKIAAAIRHQEGLWKVSLRSKDPRLNVSAIAAEFGGGGHRQAAALRWRGGLEDLIARLKSRCAAELAGLGGQ